MLLGGVDVLDGTPVLDIKPYLPYADHLPEANAGWADEPIERYPVAFSQESEEVITRFVSGGGSNHTRLLLENVLALDPRPTSQRRASPIGAQKSDGLPFAFRFLDFDVQWKIRAGGIHVERLVPMQSPPKLA